VPARARSAGKRLTDALLAVDGITGVRGLGLLLAAELAEPVAKDVAGRALEAGLVVNAVTEHALRLAPSLLVSDDEIDQGVALLASVLSS
jgi:acetylornithine/succinyldiaminopimelate/putrescine aminotransferase